MQDLTLELDHRPGALAHFGEALIRAGISVEGGGAWVAGGTGAAHFLVEDGAAAAAALAAAGLRVTAVRDVITLRLKQDQPGQLGQICRRMSDAGVSIEVLYSDHDHQLVLVAEPVGAAAAVAEQWMNERAAAARALIARSHDYTAAVEWTGNTGGGTRDYRSYSRNHEVRFDGKPAIHGSSDPAFRGDPTRHSPEELLLGALASCHMLWYLHLCAVNGVTVVAYRDHPSGVMQEQRDGAGQFTRVVLRPVVTIASGGDVERARALHEDAHRACFIARSVNFPVHLEPEVRSG